MCDKSIGDELLEACFGSIMDEEVERQKWLNDLDEGPSFISRSRYRHRGYRPTYTLIDEQSDIIEELVDDLAIEKLPHIQETTWEDLAKGE